MEINGYFGTLREGAVRLRDGHRLDWRVDPGASLAVFGLALDLRLTGPGTEIAGRLEARRPWGEDLRLGGVTGRASWALVAAVAPRLAIACDASAAIEDLALARSPAGYGGSGGMRSGPGSCLRTDRAMDPVPVPALQARIVEAPEGIAVVLTPAGDPQTTYAQAELTNSDLILLTVAPEGAALVPGMPASGEITLEFPLSALR